MIAFCFETSDELDKFLATPEGRGSFQCIPVNYQAYQYALSLGLAATNIYELADEREFELYRRESEELVDKLAEAFNRFSKSIDKEILIGDYFLFHFQIVVGMYLLRSFYLKKIFENRSYEKVFYYRKFSTGKLLYGFRPDLDGNYFYILENLFPEINSVGIDGPSSTAPNSVRAVIKSIARKILYQGPFWIYNSWICHRENIRRGSRKIATGGFLGPLYDWKPLLSDLRERCNVRFFHLEYFVDRRSKFETEIELFLRKSPELTTWLGKNFIDLLKPQFRIVGSTLEYILKNKNRFKEQIRQIDFVLTTVTPYPLQGFFAHLAREAGKEVVYLQHGEKAVVVGDRTTRSTEGLFGTVYLAWGTGVTPEYKKYFRRVEAVGSPRIYNLYQDCLKRPRGDKVLYATGKFLKDAIYFLGIQGPDEKLTKSQIALYQYFSKIPHEKILFRPNNTLHFDETAAGFNLLENVIMSKEPFGNSLAQAKMIILDAPATTCIEACSTEIPMFVLMNRAKWDEGAIHLLKKRAVVETTIEELIIKIDDFLKTGRYGADTKNKDFLFSYGLPNLDQNPSVKIISCVDEIINSKGVIRHRQL